VRRMPRKLKASRVQSSSASLTTGCAGVEQCSRMLRSVWHLAGSTSCLAESLGREVLRGLTFTDGGKWELGHPRSAEHSLPHASLSRTWRPASRVAR